MAGQSLSINGWARIILARDNVNGPQRQMAHQVAELSRWSARAGFAQ